MYQSAEYIGSLTPDIDQVPTGEVKSIYIFSSLSTVLIPY